MYPQNNSEGFGQLNRRSVDFVIKIADAKMERKPRLFLLEKYLVNIQILELFVLFTTFVRNAKSLAIAIHVVFVSYFSSPFLDGLT